MSKYDNFHRPEDAKAKLCPWLKTNCVANSCMAWRWEDRPYKQSTKSPGKGWKLDDDMFSIMPKNNKYWVGQPTGRGHCRRSD